MQFLLSPSRMNKFMSYLMIASVVLEFDQYLVIYTISCQVFNSHLNHKGTRIRY
jgi:hypothetical protein